MEVDNRLRTKIRQDSKISEHVRVSLQSCKPINCEAHLSERIANFEKGLLIRSSHENQAHIENLKGLRAVMQNLMANVEVAEKTVRLSYMEFEEALALFLSYRSNAVKSMLSDRHQRKMFMDLICHPNHGLPVYLVQNQYVLLRSEDVDLDFFLETISKPKDDEEKECFPSEMVKDILDSVDTNWDRKVCKVILGANLSKQEHKETGLGSRVYKYRSEVLETIEARKAARNEAETIVRNELSGKCTKIEETILAEKKNLEKKSRILNQNEHDELVEKINDLAERKLQLADILENRNPKGLRQMVNRMYRKLITEKRIGIRKASSGRPQQIDEEDERFILQCIEEKSTAHGRRHDAVLYTGHRVKKKDFLKLANYSRISRGLKPINSATTVFNRGKPRNKRSTQAKKHLGLGLFCGKKPPKLKDNENVLTHHQRAFKKGILLRRLQLSKNEEANFNMFISRDDKAYICPGTSTGVQSARNVRIVQPTDISKQKSLPKYDFPMRLVNATPGVNRIMDFELKEVDDETKIKIVEDNSVVFNRPKYFVGSNGTVWASEFMRMRYLEPRLFLFNQMDELQEDLSSLIQLMDKVRLYSLSTVKDDVFNVTKEQNCQFRRYEEERLNSLKLTVDGCSVFLNKEEIKENVDSLLKIIEKLQLTLQSQSGSVLWKEVSNVAKVCDDLYNQISNYIPKLKPRLHEFTDAGPGVAVSNLDVRFRIAEITMVTNLDYYIRHHLAADDSSHNEVERIQSYVGDAICDGGAIDWEYKQQYEGLSEDQLNQMSLEDLEKSELERMKYNAFKVCEELTLRINGAPAPGGRMKAYSSQKNEVLFFNNHGYLKDYLSSSEKKRVSLPGYHYFKLVESFVDQHFEVGEKYMEYTRYSCNIPSCWHCNESGWIGAPCDKIPKPFPDYTADGMHYLSVLDTPLEVDGVRRAVDDFQPRKQVKDHLEKLTTDEEIEEFSKKYIVERTLLTKYIEHLKMLEINKNKRAEKRKIEKEQQSKKEFKDYDWPLLFNNGLIKKLKVTDLNKYLSHHGLCKSIGLKKEEKVKFISAHIASTMLNQPVVADQSELSDSDTSDDNLESELENSDNDLVIADTADFETPSDDSDSDDDTDIEEIFTTTRSGRITTNWKANQYM